MVQLLIVQALRLQHSWECLVVKLHKPTVVGIDANIVDLDRAPLNVFWSSRFKLLLEVKLHEWHAIDRQRENFSEYIAAERDLPGQVVAHETEQLPVDLVDVLALGNGLLFLELQFHLLSLHIVCGGAYDPLIVVNTVKLCLPNNLTRKQELIASLIW